MLKYKVMNVLENDLERTLNEAMAEGWTKDLLVTSRGDNPWVLLVLYRTNEEPAVYSRPTTDRIQCAVPNISNVPKKGWPEESEKTVLEENLDRLTAPKDEPYMTGSSLPFNRAYPTTGIRLGNGDMMRKRVIDTLVKLNAMMVEQLVMVKESDLDGLDNCGAGTKAEVLRLRNWAKNKLKEKGL